MTTRLLTPDAFPQLIDALTGAERLYVDTEFHAEHRYLPRLYLLQVATETGPIWLIDASDLEPLRQLAPVLCAAEWVVHGGSNDIAILAKVLGAVPDRVWDTQILAGLITPDYPRRFQDLVQHWTDEQVDKGATLTNWKRRPLSPEQLAYAREDVRCLRPLARALLSAVESAGRLSIAAAACDDARQRAIDGPDPDNVWRRLQAARSLNPEQASVLREIASWREDVSRENNQPPRQVLHDGLMLELARTQVSSIADLERNRRVPRRIATEHGEALVEATARGLHRAKTDPAPLVAKFSDTELTVICLDAAARVLGKTEGWSVDLVLPRHTQWDVALSQISDLEPILGWRADLVGPLVRRALHGDLLVRRGPTGWTVQ